MKKLGIILLVMFFVFGSVSMASFEGFGNNELGGAQASINSLGASLYTMMLIVNVIVYLGIPAVIALIFCAIKAKKEGGFSNDFKKSFLKVFFIILGVIIVFEILINIIL